MSRSTDARAAPACLILNPASGGAAPLLRRLTRAARKRGIRSRVLAPGEDAGRAALEAADDGARALAVAGGDGSVASVAGVAVERRVGELVRAGIDGEPVTLEAPLRFSADPGALRVLLPDKSPTKRQLPPLEAGWHAALTLRRWLSPPRAPNRQIVETSYKRTSRCRRWDFDAGIMGGVGEATVLVPSEVGVRVRAEGGLGKINAEGFQREGEA